MKTQNAFLENLQLKVNPWKPVLLLLASTISMVVYLYINRSDAYRLLDLGPVIKSLITLPGDLPNYVVRFSSSALFLGILPMSLALLLGYPMRYLGLRRNAGFLRSRIFWICLVVAPLSAVFGALTTDLYNFYPFSHTLISLYPKNPGILAIHALLYFVLYYLPWEILFRGILIFPFLPPQTVEAPLSPSPAEVIAAPTILIVASWQILPTVLMHLPNPISETLGAIPFGLLCAYLAVRFRSIWPGLLIHAFAGIAVDFAIIMRHNA